MKSLWSLVALSIAVASFSWVSPLSYNNSRSTSKERDSGLISSFEALCFEYQALCVLTERKKKVPPLFFLFCEASYHLSPRTSSFIPHGVKGQIAPTARWETTQSLSPKQHLLQGAMVSEVDALPLTLRVACSSQVARRPLSLLADQAEVQWRWPLSCRIPYQCLPVTEWALPLKLPFIPCSLWGGVFGKPR